MLIGNPSFIVEKEKTKKYDWMNKVRVVYKNRKISSKTGFYNGDGKVIFKEGSFFTSEEGEDVADILSDGNYDYDGYIILDKTCKILKKHKLFNCLKNKNLFDLLKSFIIKIEKICFMILVNKQLKLIKNKEDKLYKQKSYFIKF